MLIKAQHEALKSQLADLRLQIHAYEALKSGRITSLTTTQMGQIGQKLIEARIAQNLTQRDLANRLHMKEQQVQRYEKEKYASASLARLMEVASAMDVNFQFEMTFDPPAHSADIRKHPIEISYLPLKIIRERNWLDFNSTISDERPSPESLLAKFAEPAFRDATPALLRQGTRLGADYNEYALLAWKARIIWKARKAVKRAPYLLRTSAIYLG